ncbi:DUF3084 domain-containing protein [Thermus sp.]|uniref:DUF3084 domain-containing protein n=1 Tax=Thermus sp. TaxID=275 RepID=UPI00307D1828
MTFWALLFLILFLSALVAYLGDRVAKWAGKRHLRLFHLRPRQTATLVAVLTGVGIALLSYLGFLLAFKEARETILEAEATRQERDRLKEEVRVLKEGQRAMEAEAARALAELNALRGERRELLLALERGEALRRALMKEAEGLKAEAQALRAERDRLKAEGKALEAKLASLGSELSAKEAKARALEGRLEKLQKEARALEAEREALLRAKARLEGDLGELRGLLAQAQREKARLEEEVAALRRALAQSRDELRQAEGRLRDLLAQAQVLEGQKGQLSASLARLARGLDLGVVVLKGGEGREVLLKEADRRARALGFKGAELLPLALPGPGVVFLEGAGYREGLLQVEGRFYPLRRAFSQGEVLASATFRLAGEAQAREVLEALGKEARARLLEAGFPPEYAAFPTPEALAQGLGLLRGRRGVVRVGVVAEAEALTTEPPLLAFRLLGGPPSPEVPVPTRQVP